MGKWQKKKVLIGREEIGLEKCDFERENNRNFVIIQLNIHGKM